MVRQHTVACCDVLRYFACSCVSLAVTRPALPSLTRHARCHTCCKCEPAAGMVYWIPLVDLSLKSKNIIEYSTFTNADVTILKLGYSRPQQALAMLYSNSTAGFDGVVALIAPTAHGIVVSDLYPLEFFQVTAVAL